jgi:hypothetical protein
MLIEETPLLREIAGAALKTTIVVLALVLVYPYVLSALAHILGVPHASP